MNGVETYSDKTLSIRISTDGFCFCIYTATLPDSLQYYHYEVDRDITLVSNFEKACKECPFIAEKRFEHINAIIANGDFTTLPAEYDKPEDYSKIFRCCFPQCNDNIEIIANRLTAQNITILFSVEKSLYNRLNELGNVSYYTPPGILMGYIARKPFEAPKYLLAYLQKGKSLLFAIADGKLQLTNSFASRDINDQAYYILSIWKEQELSQTNDTLYLCGDNTVEEISPMLSRFIQNRKRINPNSEFRPNLLNKIKEIPFDLQALLLCE